jgi:hypothetical protein
MLFHQNMIELKDKKTKRQIGKERNIPDVMVRSREETGSNGAPALDGKLKDGDSLWLALPGSEVMTCDISVTTTCVKQLIKPAGKHIR